MSLLKQLAFDNWHEVTVENLDSWIQKVHKLKKKDFQKHVVFSEIELERELHDIKNQNKYRSKLDYMLKTGRKRLTKKQQVVDCEKAKKSVFRQRPISTA